MGSRNLSLCKTIRNKFIRNTLPHWKIVARLHNQTRRFIAWLLVHCSTFVCDVPHHFVFRSPHWPKKNIKEKPVETSVCKGSLLLCSQSFFHLKLKKKRKHFYADHCYSSQETKRRRFISGDLMRTGNRTLRCVESTAQQILWGD